MVDNINKKEGMEYLLKLAEVIEILQKINWELINLLGGLHVISDSSVDH